MLDMPHFSEHLLKRAPALFSGEAAVEVQTMSNIAWFLGKSGRYSKEFFDLTESLLPTFLKDCDERIGSQNLLNIAWAIVILGKSKEHEKLLRALWDACFANQDPHRRRSAAEATVVCHIEVLARSSGVLLERPGWFDQKPIWSTTPSLQQREVEATLASLNMGTVVSEACPTAILPEGADRTQHGAEMLPIDAAILDDKLAVEYHGPSHYVITWNLENDKGRDGARDGKDGVVVEEEEEEEVELQFLPSGPTLAKERFLRELGWTTVILPFYEWQMMEKEEKEEYLSTKISIEKGELLEDDDGFF
jgi:hypothetical protein